MNKREIAHLACRILAVYTILLGIGGIPELSTLLFVNSAFDWRSVLVQVITGVWPVVMFAIGMVIWWRAGIIAAWMVGYDIQDHPLEPDDEPVRASDLQHIAFSTLGLWALIDVTPRLVYNVGLAVFSYGDWMLHVGTAWRSALSIGGVLAQVSIGVWLLFGAGSIVNLLNGSPKKVTSGQAESPSGDKES